MESQIATFEDATLILKLYELRSEEVLRKARQWLIFEFNPNTPEEFLVFVGGNATPEHAYFRQVFSYWEMAASLVLRGAVKADLFLDSNGEGLFLYAKFYRFREEIQAKTGRPFMRNTGQMIERYPTARDMFGSILKSVEASRS